MLQRKVINTQHCIVRKRMLPDLEKILFPGELGKQPFSVILQVYFSLVFPNFSNDFSNISLSKSRVVLLITLWNQRVSNFVFLGSTIKSLF